mmetsp:Transcript_20139/g.19109  ORF Transcript_20139/g.19109 Transcript_20139/m.19109 type:complete len:120 (+) Transcript_20139:414-773(+)
MRINFADEDDDNQDSLQQTIFNATDEITDIVKATDTKLKELINCQSEDDADEQIRKNIQISLATRLKDLTMEIKRSEKEHFLKVQELHGEEFISSKSQKDFMQDDEGAQFQSMLQEEDE